MMRRYLIVVALLAILCLTGCKDTQNPAERELAAFTTYMSRMGYREETMEFYSGYDYSYDEKGQCISEDSNGSIHTFACEYDGNGSLIKKTEYDSDGEVICVYEYVNGNLVRKDSLSLKLISEYTYNDKNQMIQWAETYTAYEEPYVYEEFYKYDDEGHKVWEGYDRYHPNQTWEYDSNGNLIKQSVNNGSTKIEYQYDEQGLLLCEIHYEVIMWNTERIYSYTKNTYDDEGRILKIEEIYLDYDEEGNVEKSETERLYVYSYYGNTKREDAYYKDEWYMTQLWNYDEAGNEIKHMVFEKCNEGVRMSAWEVTEYDAQNRVTKELNMRDDCWRLYGDGCADGIFVREVRYDENGNTTRDITKRQNLNENFDYGVRFER